MKWTEEDARAVVEEAFGLARAQRLETKEQIGATVLFFADGEGDEALPRLIEWGEWENDPHLRAHILRMIAVKVGARFLCTISECWTVRYPSAAEQAEIAAHLAAGGRIATHPLRKEMMLANFEGVTGSTIYTSEIRPDGTLSDVERTDSGGEHNTVIKGTMTALLPQPTLVN